MLRLFLQQSDAFIGMTNQCRYTNTSLQEKCICDGVQCIWITYQKRQWWVHVNITCRQDDMARVNLLNPISMINKRKNLWVTSFKSHCLVFFVCLCWKVGSVSTGVVTVFVFFPSVLPVIRTTLILFLQLTHGSLKRINQYPLLIPHTAASYLKPCPSYFFLLYPFFQELTQNCDALTGQMFSLLLFHTIFTSECPFF